MSKDLHEFEKLVERWEKPIFGHVWRLVGQREDAQDLTQETFVKAFKNRGRIDPRKNISAWLYKIATNTVYDWWRRKKRRPEILLGDSADSLVETNGADKTYESIEVAQDLEKALSRLKPLHQTVIWLFYRQEFTYEEMADILDLPLNSVKTLLRRAKANFRIRLRQDQSKTT